MYFVASVEDEIIALVHERKLRKTGGKFQEIYFNYLLTTILVR